MNDQIAIDQNVIEELLMLLDNTLEDNAASDSKQEKSEISHAMHTVYTLKNFMDEMPGGFFIYHADGKKEIIYANKAMLQLFNCDTMTEFREQTGNSFRGIVHPDDLDEVESRIQKQISASQYDLDRAEYRIIREGGEIRWIEDYGHFLHSRTAGDIFYVFAGDVTEKLTYEEQLQNQLQEYDQDLEGIQQEQLRRLETIEGLSIDYESIFYVNLDKNRIKAYRVSERFMEQFPPGHRMCEFVGFDADYIEKYVYPDDRKVLYGITNPEYIRGRLATEKSFHINYRIYKNEKVAYIQLRVVNVGSEEHISQVVLGYRNIDDEIIQEMKQKQIVEKALEEANRANSAKNLFLSNMSHDIRTPMNAIVGFASLAQKHITDGEKVFNYLNMIASASDQLLQLLNDVLEISRIEAGKLQVEESECSLIDVAHQVQMDLLPQAVAKNITISLDVSGLKHDVVYADQSKLVQVLSYIVDNAVKYTKVNGWVMISVIEKGEEITENGYTTYQIVVEDNGIGISPQFINHIFEPFEREKNTTLSGIHGTGLGMTIAKDIVEMIGGTIDVTSVVDKGSKFVITLHLHAQSRQSIYSDFDDEETDDSLNFLQTKRILIVDDNEINLEIENEVLRDAGFLVDTAEDGSIAVEKVKLSQPGDYDLILMDIQMPIMDGYHAARAIREIDNPTLAGIPIIAVSANAFEEDRKMAFESGMNEHLAKPLDTPRLYRLIKKFLKDKEQTVYKEKKRDMLIRSMVKEEYPLLKDFLYNDIYHPKGSAQPPQDKTERSEIAAHIQNFGQPDDICLVAESEGELLGAVWARIIDDGIKGHGSIDSSTPMLAISVKKEFCHQGIGRKLMQEMIAYLKKHGYEKASLSVNKDNYACRMFRKLGFQVVKVGEQDYLMVMEL